MLTWAKLLPCSRQFFGSIRRLRTWKGMVRKRSAIWHRPASSTTDKLYLESICHPRKRTYRRVSRQKLAHRCDGNGTSYELRQRHSSKWWLTFGQIYESIARSVSLPVIFLLPSSSCILLLVLMRETPGWKQPRLTAVESMGFKWVDVFCKAVLNLTGLLKHKNELPSTGRSLCLQYNSFCTWFTIRGACKINNKTHTNY